MAKLPLAPGLRLLDRTAKSANHTEERQPVKKRLCCNGRLLVVPLTGKHLALFVRSQKRVFHR